MKPILEHIRLGKEKSIFAFQYEKSHFETPWHFHPQHELTYIDESHGTKFIGDYVGPFEPGELVLLRSNLPHCWKNLHQPTRMARSTVIQWNTGIFTKAPEIFPIFEMMGFASRGILFSKEDTRDLIPIIKNLAHRNGGSLYIGLLSLLMLLAECNYSTLSEASFTDKISTEFSTRISGVHEFVESNYHRKIYLKEIARIVNMSESSFSRYFSKMMGRPFFSFLNEYRINTASRMLIDSDRSIAEIGFACGYESLPFFHKQFKKYKSVAPSKFRKRFRQ